jgi:hypothetical protein
LDAAIFTGITTAGPDVTILHALFARHVGTAGGDVGKIRLRFYSTTLESGTTLNIDQIYVSYAEAVSGSIALILADTAELQAEMADGGRTDLLIDAIKTKTDFLPSYTAGQAGGVFIAGANAATTFAALTVTAATTFGGAVVITDQTTALSLGKYLKDILDDTAVLPATWVVPGTGTSTLTTTDVQTYCDAAITANTLVKDLPTNSELTTALGTSWTTALTEAYPAYDATSMTPAQALYAILQSVSDFAITGLNISVKNLAGTEAMKFTMDSATVPTLRSRAAP